LEIYVVIAGGRVISDLAAMDGVQELTTSAPGAREDGSTPEERVFVIRRDLKKD